MEWIAHAWHRLVSVLLLRQRRKREKQKLRPPSAKTFFMGTDSVDDDSNEDDNADDEDVVEWDWVSANFTDNNGNIDCVEQSKIFPEHANGDVDIEKPFVQLSCVLEELAGSLKHCDNVHSQRTSNQDSHSSVSAWCHIAKAIFVLFYFV
jgi:hypothetical protein